MKKPDAFVKDYLSRLPDDGLKFLSSRLGQRLQGDLAEAIDYLSRAPEMDRWLSSAKGAPEFYDMLDTVARLLDREYNRRF